MVRDGERDGGDSISARVCAVRVAAGRVIGDEDKGLWHRVVIPSSLPSTDGIVRFRRLLTRREYEVAELIASGYCWRQIREMLGIGQMSLWCRVVRIKRKLREALHDQSGGVHQTE